MASGSLADKLRELDLRENQEVYVRGIVVDAGPSRNCSAFFGTRVTAEEVVVRE